MPRPCLIALAFLTACATDAVETPQATTTSPKTTAPRPGAARAPKPPKESAAIVPEVPMAWHWIAQGSSWMGARPELKIWAQELSQRSHVHVMPMDQGLHITRIRDFADSNLMWHHPLAPDLDPSTKLKTSMFHRDQTIYVLLTRPDRVELQARKLKDGELIATNVISNTPRLAQFDLHHPPTKDAKTSLRVYLKAPAEVLDLHPLTLKTQAHHKVDPALAKRADAPWSWTLPDRNTLWKKRAKIEHKIKGAVYVFERKGHFEGLLRRTFPARDVLWQKKDLEPQTLLGTRGSCLHVATGSFIATGVRLMCLEPNTGETRWSRHIFGIGPIGHSKYSNVFDMRYEGEHIVVQGLESSGKYVEVVSATTGESLVNVRYLEVF